MSTIKKKTGSKTVLEKIISNSKQILKDRFVIYPLVVALLIIIGIIVYLFFMAGYLPSTVPLYYSLPWGEERLAQTSWMLLVPVSVFGFLLLNILLILFTHRTETVFARMLAISASFVTFLSLYSIVKIVFLIT